MLRAKQNGTKLVILIEHSNRIRCIDDVRKWENPRRKYSPMAMNGDVLARTMETQEQKYGIKYEFCDKEHTGERIIEILKGGSDE